MASACGIFMVKEVDDLLVYQKAIEAADEISDILKAKGFAEDHRLRNQLGASSERVASLIAEGFEQKTDRHFASYLHLSRGSSSETRTQLRIAKGRGYVTESRQEAVSEKYQEIERMLRGLIRHLNEDDWKDRR
jgi:four helix bundle protein